MSDPALLMLATEVRAKTLRRLEGVTEAEAQFKGADGLNNSILWHAGHALVVVEQLSVEPLSNRPSPYPPNWKLIFGGGSKPATVSEWPSFASVVAALNEQLKRLTALIETSTMNHFDQVINADKNQTLRYSVLHGLHDEACHSGEIYLLRKLYKAGR